jgi:hypothetical protein
MLAFPGAAPVNSVGALLRSCTPQELEVVYDSSWGSSRLTFTKEVFSPLQLPFFVRHFRTFVLLRAARHTFPSGEAGGGTAYLALFDSLMSNTLGNGSLHLNEEAVQTNFNKTSPGHTNDTVVKQQTRIKIQQSIRNVADRAKQWLLRRYTTLR